MDHSMEAPAELTSPLEPSWRRRIHLAAFLVSTSLPSWSPSRAGGYLSIGMGWIVVIALPAVLTALGPRELLLLFTGGVLYTVGALCLRFQRPNPRPLMFGYHEFWHAMTVAAAACHFALIAMLVRA
jgi:hemolysin III